MLRNIISVSIFITIMVPCVTFADELTQMIQQDLVTLSYDPGDADGEMSTKTIVAISKFQAEHDLEVTGEASPQLAGIIKANINSQNNPSTGVAAATPAATQSPADVQAAQQACLMEKMQQAQASKKKKRGLGSLMRAVSRTAAQFGDSHTANAIAQSSSDAYNVNATAADLESAAKDLGLSEGDMEACRNPQ